MKRIKQKGISLIILVITIIVMVVIAGTVVISLAQNDIIGTAQNATEKNLIAEIEEKLNVIAAEWNFENDNDSVIYAFFPCIVSFSYLKATKSNSCS